ncbi:MAG: transcription initiation factor IIB [Candidatus Hodarchaeales archaeon]|jgi:transcription initiation factor TFIIB
MVEDNSDSNSGISEKGIRNKCPECGSKYLVEDRGSLICSRCGLVVSDGSLFELGPEWRSYSIYEEKCRSRSGDPFSPLSADGLRTRISKSLTDAYGKKISTEARYDFIRMSNIDNRTRHGEIRNLRIALKELKRIKSQLELNESIAKSASLIYRKSLKMNLIRGRSIDGMIAASIYLACRQAGIPLTLKEILSVTSSVNSKELGRCVRILIKELKIRPPANSNWNAIVHKLGEQLQLTMYTRKIATEIIDRAREEGITVGKNPTSICSAALYIAGVKSGERRTQQQIAQVAKTTPVTIRNRFKELLRVLDIKHVEVKRGAAAVPVYITDPTKFYH